VGGRIVEGGLRTAKIILRGVHFAFNKYNIRPADAGVLDEAAATLKQNPNVRVDVNGYTDSVGSADYNLRLSDRRARAVVDYLEKDGVSADRLSPHRYGKTDFVAPNSTAEGRAAESACRTGSNSVINLECFSPS
jgi:OmpA-OmpF porin, OOP family